MPVLKKKKTKSKPVINFRNDDGWAKYAEISNKNTPDKLTTLGGLSVGYIKEGDSQLVIG